ncbi:hypothetical protein AAY473_035799 [Plecturocebus cupreus]
MIVVVTASCPNNVAIMPLLDLWTLETVHRPPAVIDEDTAHRQRHTPPQLGVCVYLWSPCCLLAKLELHLRPGLRPSPMGSVHSLPWGWRCHPPWALPRFPQLLSLFFCRGWKCSPPALQGSLLWAWCAERVFPLHSMRCGVCRAAHIRARPPRVPSCTLDMPKSPWPGPLLMRPRH